MDQTETYYVRVNDTEECLELMQRGGATEGGWNEPQEDALLARFYDGDGRRSYLAEWLAAQLNAGNMPQQA